MKQSLFIVLLIAIASCEQKHHALVMRPMELQGNAYFDNLPQVWDSIYYFNSGFEKTVYDSNENIYQSIPANDTFFVIRSIIGIDLCYFNAYDKKYRKVLNETKPNRKGLEGMQMLDTALNRKVSEAIDKFLYEDSVIWHNHDEGALK